MIKIYCIHFSKKKKFYVSMTSFINICVLHSDKYNNYGKISTEAVAWSDVKHDSSNI